MSLHPDDKVLVCSRLEDAPIVLRGWAQVTCEECGATCLVTKTGQGMIAGQGFKVGCMQCVSAMAALTGQEPSPSSPEMEEEFQKAMVAIQIRDAMRGKA